MTEVDVVVPSRYNFVVPFGEDTLVFNAFSGALIALRGADGGLIAAGLMCEADLAIEEIPHPLVGELLEKGFLTVGTRAQFAQIRERFVDARRSTPMVLTITTTLDCNLGCYYCYQDRSPDQLRSSDIPRIVSDTRERLIRSDRDRLHVDWYGGEPLANLGFIEQCSSALQTMCRELGVRYRASVISNGTMWPEDVAAFVERHAVSQVQISFDGLAARHDKIRRYRAEEDRSAGLSSFGRAAHVVDRLADHVRVDVRFNLDRISAEDLIGFVRAARARGWFDKRFPVVIQPARVADYSERSGFLKDHKLSLEEFDRIRDGLRSTSMLEGGFPIEESEAPDGYPYPKTALCAALTDDSLVVGADGRTFRCGLQVSEPQRSVSTIRPLAASRGTSSVSAIPVVVTADAAQVAQAAWWRSFDPCEQPTCAVCSFLPICMGGCPKKHLEGDRDALDEQGAYWRRNLPRLLVSAVRPGSSTEHRIPVEHQFRR